MRYDPGGATGNINMNMYVCMLTIFWSNGIYFSVCVNLTRRTNSQVMYVIKFLNMCFIKYIYVS
jgi:hypothetical protein